MKLPFITIKRITQAPIKIDKNITIKKSPNSLRKISIAFISVFLLALFIYSTNSHFKKTPKSDTTVTKAEVKISGTHTDSETTSTEQKKEPKETSIPSLTIEEPLTYTIPDDYVALTFDDGPSKYTKEIVDLLKRYEVGGTFFFNGINVEKHADSVSYAHSNGYSIGNHSMNHLNLSGLATDKLNKEINQSAEIIEKITKEKVTLFRPPYGAINDQVKNAIYQNQYKVVLWNNDPKDWQSRNAEAIYNNIRTSKTSGSIILLHETEATIEALPRIIEHLQKQNLKLVNLE